MKKEIKNEQSFHKKKQIYFGISKRERNINANE